MAVKIVEADKEGIPHVAILDPRTFTADERYFVDGREGTDRWGNERKDRIACGTGWDDYVCPLYVSEACPGERNFGTRWLPPFNTVCDLACGTCGGGLRADTTDFCGHPRGQPGLDYAIWEMGGNLRLDSYTAPPVSPPPVFPCAFAPTAEWGARAWMDELHKAFDGHWPMILTTLKTATPGNRREPTLLRERLGDYTGLLAINGQTQDDYLDDCWENRHRILEYQAASGVDLVCTPQFSYYDIAETAGWIYNIARSFEWYRLAVEAGIPHVSLDMPPFAMPWIYDEYLGFVERANVKCVSISLQTFSKVKQIQMRSFHELQRRLPADVSIVSFGINTLATFVKLATPFRGRNLVFSNVAPFIQGAFYKLPDHRRAPAGWTQAHTFAFDSRMFQDQCQRVLDTLNETSGPELADYRPPVEGEGEANSRSRRGSSRTPRPRRGSRRSSRR